MNVHAAVCPLVSHRQVLHWYLKLLPGLQLKPGAPGATAETGSSSLLACRLDLICGWSSKKQNLNVQAAIPFAEQKQSLQPSALLNDVPGTHCVSFEFDARRFVLGGVGKQNFIVQAACPLSEQKQSLHPSALLNVVPGTHSFFGG